MLPKMRRVIAYVPEPPVHNPPETVSMDPTLANNLVRLEAPVELPGSWDGPVYARMGGAPRRLLQDNRSVFSAPDDIGRPGWPCTIMFLRPGQFAPDITDVNQRGVIGEEYCVPFWRLTQPALDLDALEATERPLLSVFRFLRFSVYFTPSSGDGPPYVQQTSDVFLCGQVLTCSPLKTGHLVDASGATIEPGSTFLCHVEIRHVATGARRVVGVPLDEFWSRTIPVEQYVLGFLHGVATTTTTTDFATPWASIKRKPHGSRPGLRRQLIVDYATTTSSSTVDVDCTIWMVRPSGHRVDTDPLDFARAALTPVDSIDVDDASPLSPPPPTGPLLTRAEALLTPHDSPDQIQVAVTSDTVQDMPVLPAVMPGVSAPGSVAAAQVTVAAQAAAAAQVAAATQAVAAAQATVAAAQATVAARITPTPRAAAAPVPASTAAPPVIDVNMDEDMDVPRDVTGYLRAHGHVTNHDPPESLFPHLATPGATAAVPATPSVATPQVDERILALFEAQAKQLATMNENFAKLQEVVAARVAATPTPHPPAPGAGAATAERHSARHAPSHPRMPRPGRSVSPERRTRRSRSRRSRSPSATPFRGRGPSSSRRSRSRSPPRRGRESTRSPSRSRSFDGGRRRRNDRDRSEPRAGGKDRFIPPPGGETVNEIIRVGPRAITRTEGTDRDFLHFRASAPHDRITHMLQSELVRCGHASKVMMKMLYCVDFYSRPLDYWLSSEDASMSRHRRIVVHDDTRWGGKEPRPTHALLRPSQLKRALHAVADAASWWYPMLVANAFRAVLDHANQHIPEDILAEAFSAHINLYTSVFSALQRYIGHHEPFDRLEGLVRDMLDPDSPAYRCSITTPLNQMYMRQRHQLPDPVAVAHRQQDGLSHRPRQRAQTRVRQANTAASSTVIPPGIRNKIPLGPSNRAVCLRFQTAKGCDFASCHHDHTVTRLAPDVLTWLTTHHGALKATHPQY